jgi:hypothetical protein
MVLKQISRNQFERESTGEGVPLASHAGGSDECAGGIGQHREQGDDAQHGGSSLEGAR